MQGGGWRDGSSGEEISISVVAARVEEYVGMSRCSNAKVLDFMMACYQRDDLGNVVKRCGKSSSLEVPADDTCTRSGVQMKKSIEKVDTKTIYAREKAAIYIT